GINKYRGIWQNILEIISAQGFLFVISALAIGA
ncbi:unnamed protein product, partial [methanotrophic bacterial endosymbiont of Bathymodiolus sp.]